MTLLSLAIAAALVCVVIFLLGYVPDPNLRVGLRIAAAVIFLVWLLFHSGILGTAH